MTDPDASLRKRGHRIDRVADLRDVVPPAAKRGSHTKRRGQYGAAVLPLPARGHRLAVDMVRLRSWYPRSTVSGSRFVSVGASCSFCGKDLGLVPMIVGMQDQGAAICGECVGLCCDILTEYAEAVEPTPFYGKGLSFDEDRFRIQLAAVLVSLSAQRERRLAKQAAPPSSPDAPRCSFCDLHTDGVAKLINGPGVHICEGCVAAAAQTIGDELRRGATV